MSYRLAVEPVQSSSQLRRALSPGQAGEHGDFDGETLVVKTENTAKQLIGTYPNVDWADNQDTEREPETVRMQADSEGVSYECGVNGCSRTVDGPDDTCWQHEESDD